MGINKKMRGNYGDISSYEYMKIQIHMNKYPDKMIVFKLFTFAN